MTDKIAKTVAAAIAQEFTLPEFSQWRQFASLINGYPIAAELSLDFGSWGNEHHKNWAASQTWDLDLLHLRVMLFYIFRRDYFTGYTYTEHDEIVDSLLQAISEITQQPYHPKFGSDSD